MFLECFLHDPFDAEAWFLDVDHYQEVYVVGTGLEIVESKGYRHIAPPALPIADRLETLAEEMLWRAAALHKKALTKARVLELYKRHVFAGGLDVPFSQVLRIRGQNVAVPTPEYLGLYFSNNAGKANLVLYNSRTVIPISGSG